LCCMRDMQHSFLIRKLEMLPLDEFADAMETCVSRIIAGLRTIARNDRPACHSPKENTFAKN